MKLVAKIIVSIAALYVVAWMVLAAYFSFAGQHKELLESHLSSLFDRPVSVESVQTNWQGLSPQFEVNGFHVKGDANNLSALSFKKLSAKLDPISILKFWPRFTQFSIEEPEIEIANLASGQLQIAGFSLGTNRSLGLNPRRLISWLLDNESASWQNGTVVWRRLSGDVERFEDISFDYGREQQIRTVTASVRLPEGMLAFKGVSNGDVINSNDWDASLEVLGDQGESFLGSDDLSLSVADGKGRLVLKSLGIQKVRDLLQLTGLGGSQNWLLTSELSGQLSNAQFDFSGPLLDFYDWSVKAEATNVSFKSTDSLPAMNNLSGAIAISSQGGVFNFATQDAEFVWDQWFEQPFPISQASGQFAWDLSQAEKMVIKLTDGVFSDQVTNLRNLDVNLEITTNQTRITNFADLFKTSSIEKLSYEAGEVVSQEQQQPFSGSTFLEASADFDVPDVSLVGNYFPKDPRIEKFRTWWSNAILMGSATDGRIRYLGNLSKTALYDGSASLVGQANYQDVDLDYGYQRDWPMVTKGKGIVRMENATLSFLSEEGWIADDQVDRATVEIRSIFRDDRELYIDAGMRSTVPTVMDFLIAGPLIKKSTDGEQPIELPVSFDSGVVDANVEINIPLNQIRSAKVRGDAVVEGAQITLPQGVLVKGIGGNVNFTETSADSENIKGEFLGGPVSAQLITTEAAQPPVLKLVAQGSADVNELQPWIGNHLLSWFQGNTDWQGEILFDGPRANVKVNSDLEGVTVSAPAPLAKKSIETRSMELALNVGKDVEQNLNIAIGDDLYAEFIADKDNSNQFLDKTIISLGGDRSVKEGVNFDIDFDLINLDEWLQAIIDLTKIKVADTTNTEFLDAMRTVKLKANDPQLLGRKFGAIQMSAVSSDGGNWIGSISGANIDGVIQAEPRAEVANYRLNLSKLYIPEGPKEKRELDPIDNSLSPEKYPIIDLNVNSFRLVRKQLGRLQLRGEPIDNAWRLSNFELSHQGVSTIAQGEWVNTPETGTISSFDLETEINEAGGALQELDMGGVVSKGEGNLTANINWIGAPHEFDYSRLNGDFDLRVADGELVKIEPGTGKLLGLLNFNAIARRLTLDFSDVFSSGLEFDRMRYTGVFADGEAIMRQAYIFTPAVFVNMQGKLDLDEELIDMEIHLSPELGGNLTLLSALANPAAGALVFLTQQLFKDEMRSASYKSYRALGSWEDFEMVEFDVNEERAVN